MAAFEPFKPKYAGLEIERRWVAKPEALRLVEGALSREIEDLYVSGTSLRLRAMRGTGQAPVFKLGKKYGKTSGSFSEAITNIHLDEAEYRLRLAHLRGISVRKRRYPLAGGALDVYADSGAPLIFEVEFPSESEALAYAPPRFVAEEVIHTAALSGAAIALAFGSPEQSTERSRGRR